MISRAAHQDRGRRVARHRMYDVRDVDVPGRHRRDIGIPSGPHRDAGDSVAACSPSFWSETVETGRQPPSALAFASAPPVSVVDTVDLTELLHPVLIGLAPWERTWCRLPAETDVIESPVPARSAPRRRTPTGVTVALVAASLGAFVAAAWTAAPMGEGPAAADLASDPGAIALVAPTSPARRQSFRPPPRPTATKVEPSRPSKAPDNPLSAAPVVGTLTSGFGARWETVHYGLDIANAIGTPIVSVTDGVVIESGPASGFGLWVRIRQDDGTIGVYGHINESLVSAGQRVLAGQRVATVGNRGNSTGPHLHYEVWQSESSKLDPMAWLRARGVALQ